MVGKKNTKKGKKESKLSLKTKIKVEFFFWVRMKKCQKKSAEDIGFDCHDVVRVSCVCEK